MSIRPITGNRPYAACSLQSVTNAMHCQLITGQASDAGIVLPVSPSATRKILSGHPSSAVSKIQGAVSRTADNGKPSYVGLNLCSNSVRGKSVVEGTPLYASDPKVPAQTVGAVPMHPYNINPPQMDPNIQYNLFFQSAYGNMWSMPNCVPLFNPLPSSAASLGRPLLGQPPVVNSLTLVSSNNFSCPPPAALLPPPALLPSPTAALGGGHLYSPDNMDSALETSCPTSIAYPLANSGLVPDLAGQLEAVNVAQCEGDVVLGHSEIRVTSIQCFERSGSPGTAVTPFGRVRRPLEIKQPSDKLPVSLDPSVKEFSPRSGLKSASISEGGSFIEESKDINLSTDIEVPGENEADEFIEEKEADEPIVGENEAMVGNENNSSSLLFSTEENFDMDEIDDVQLKMTETPTKGQSDCSAWKEIADIEDWLEQSPLSRVQRNKACQTESITLSEKKKSDQTVNNKKVRLLQEEVCQLRAQLCLNELQRQRFQLELDLFWWQSNFQHVDKSQARETMAMTQNRHNSVLNQIESVQHTRDHYVSMLKNGKELADIPQFSVGLYCGEKLVPKCQVSQEASNSGSSDALASASLVDFPSSACQADSQSNERQEQDFAGLAGGGPSTVEKLPSLSEKQSAGNDKVVNWLGLTNLSPSLSRTPDLRSEDVVTAAENLKRVKLDETHDEKNKMPEEDISEVLVEAEENSNGAYGGLSAGGKLSNVCTDTSGAEKSTGDDTQASVVHSVHSIDNKSSSLFQSSEKFFSPVEPCKVEEFSVSHNMALEALDFEKNVNSDSAQMRSNSCFVAKNDQCIARLNELEANQQPQTQLFEDTPDTSENQQEQDIESSANSNDCMTVATELKESVTSIICTTDSGETQNGDAADESSRSDLKKEAKGDSAQHGDLKYDTDGKYCSSFMKEASFCQTLHVDDTFEGSGDEESENIKESGSEFKVCEEGDLSPADIAFTDQEGDDLKLGTENQGKSAEEEYSASHVMKPEGKAKKISLSEMDMFAVESDSEEDPADFKDQACADSPCPVENKATLLKECAFDTSEENKEIMTASKKNEADSLPEKEMPCQLDQTCHRVENDTVTVYKSVISKLKELYPAESKDAVWLQKTAEEQTRLFIQQMDALTQDLQGSARDDLVSGGLQPLITPHEDIAGKKVTFAPSSSQAVTSSVGSFAPTSQIFTSTMGYKQPIGYSGVNQTRAIVEPVVAVNPDDWMRKSEELSACRRLASARQNTALQEASVIQHTLFMLNQRALENPTNVDLSSQVDFTLKQYELLIQEAEKQGSLVALYDQQLRSLRSQYQNHQWPPVSQPPLAPAPHQSSVPVVPPTAYNAIQNAYPNFFKPNAPLPFSMTDTAFLPSGVPPTKTLLSRPQQQSTQVTSSLSGLGSSVTQPEVQCGSSQRTAVSSSLPKPKPRMSLAGSRWISCSELENPPGGTAPPLNTARSDSTSVPAAAAAATSAGQLTTAAEMSSSISHKRSRTETSPDRLPSLVAASEMSAPSPPAFKPLLPLKPIKFSSNRYAALLDFTDKVDESEEGKALESASEKNRPVTGKMGLDDFTFGPELQSKPKPVSPEKMWDFPRSDPEKEWHISGPKKHKSDEKSMPTSLSKKERDGPTARCTTKCPPLTNGKKRIQFSSCLSSSSSCSDSSSEPESLQKPAEVRSFQASKQTRDGGNCEIKPSPAPFSAATPSAGSRRDTRPSEQEAAGRGLLHTPALNKFTFTKTLGDGVQAKAKALSDSQKRAKAGSPSRIDTAFINQLVSNNIANNCKERPIKHSPVGDGDSVSSSASEQTTEWQEAAELSADPRFLMESACGFGKKKFRRFFVKKKRKGDGSKPLQFTDQVYRSPDGVAAAKAKKEPPIKTEALNKLTSYQKLLLDIEQEFPTLQTDDIKTVIEEVRKSRPSGHFHGMLFSEILKEVKSFIMINYASKLRVAAVSRPIFRRIESVEKKTEKKSEITWQHLSVYTDKPFQADDTECSICLLDFSLQSSYNLECGHHFHKKCIDGWVKHKGERTCPICRKMVLLSEDFPRLGGDQRGDGQARPSHVVGSVSQNTTSLPPGFYDLNFPRLGS